MKRLFHPITMAVILVGIAGFLFGLIVAVERQDLARESTQTTVAAERVRHLEAQLAERDATLAQARSELEELQRTPPPQPSATDANIERHINTLEATISEQSRELKDLQGEVAKLAGQLAAAVQARDEIRDRLEQDAKQEGERAEQQQVIADLRVQLSERDRERETFARTIAGLRDQSAEADKERARLEGELTELRGQLTETEVARSQLEEMIESLRREFEAKGERNGEPAPEAADARDGQGKAAPDQAPSDAAAIETAPAGSISQGAAAYRAGDYRKAYELWLPEALNGSRRAQFFIGALYFEGRGVTADLVTSFLWLRAATAGNDSDAMTLLEQVRGKMSREELAEAESRIAGGQAIPSQ